MNARIFLCIVTVLLGLTHFSVAQNPQMVGGVDPNLANNPMPPLSVYGVAQDPSSAAVMGTALFYSLQDNVLRKISLTDALSDVTVVGAPGVGALNTLTTCNSKLYFSGPTLTNAYSSPWASNGTAVGTTLLYSQSSSTGPGAFTMVGTKVFFTGHDCNYHQATCKYFLFTTDGTTRGTKKIVSNLDWFDGYAGIFSINANAYFFARLGNDAGLWKSNGTTKGTVFVKSTVITPLTDLLPVYSTAYVIKPLLVGNKLYFPATSATHGAELWVSDGTTNGTYMLADINPGALGSFPSDFAATTDYLYFQADDGTCGRELFRLKFSTGAVELVADIESGIGNSEPRAMTAFGQYILFHAATSAGGRDIYTFNESTSTIEDLDINPIGGDIPERGGFTGFTALYGWAYFNAYEPDYGIELFRTDGTYAGTQLVKDIYPGTNSSQPKLLTVFNNKLYFRAHDGTHGREWWVLDPTQPFSKPSVANGEAFELALLTCEPNPFNGTTTITYSVPTSLPVRIDVVDMFGQVIATLADAEQSAGSYQVTFDGRPYASGTFFCRLTAGNEQRTMKLLLLK